MTTVESTSMTQERHRNHPRASLTASGGELLPGAVLIAAGAESGPHAEVSDVGGRWRLLLVGCHRELDMSFLHLADAVKVAETLVETAILTAALAYDADPLLTEPSA